MRCNNCGWMNDEGAVICSRCHQPLASGRTAPGGPAMRDTVVGAGVGPRPTVVGVANMAKDGVAIPRPTRMDNTMGTDQQQPTQQPSAQSRQREVHDTQECQQCGYPVIAGSLTCPACGARVQQRTVMGNTLRHKVADPQPEIRQQQPEEAPQPRPVCSLTLVPEEGEAVEAIVNSYEGAEVILNRDNTEPGNYTITSRQQAKLTFENGQWYIDNLSDLGSTYIKVSRRIQLQPGDELVLGDRTFKFEA